MKVHLHGPCPIKLNVKFDSDGKFDCNHCNKHVIDFTAYSHKEITRITTDEQFDSCGSYLPVS